MKIINMFAMAPNAHMHDIIAQEVAHGRDGVYIRGSRHYGSTMKETAIYTQDPVPFVSDSAMEPGTFEVRESKDGRLLARLINVAIPVGKDIITEKS